MSDKPTNRKKNEVTAVSILAAVGEEVLQTYNAGDESIKTAVMTTLTSVVKAVEPDAEVLCATRVTGEVVAFIAKV